MSAPELIACHECDLLQRAPVGYGVARCVRCGGVLFRASPGSVERTLVYALTAAVLFVVANAFPLLTMEVKGNHNTTTLIGAVGALREQGMDSIAALVFITIIAVPALQLTAMLYVLLPVNRGRTPPGLRGVLRMLTTLRPWGMCEVFMLGVLVSVVKLTHLAHVVPGPALWSFAFMIVAMAAMAGAFQPRELWARVSW